MITERQRTGTRLAAPINRPEVKKMPARQFPVQREIQKLEEELHAFNERIAELEGERHLGHAMEVLKVNAMDCARRIDELRPLLIDSISKTAPKKSIS
jgi:DNA primase